MVFGVFIPQHICNWVYILHCRTIIFNTKSDIAAVAPAAQSNCT